MRCAPGWPSPLAQAQEQVACGTTSRQTGDRRSPAAGCSGVFFRDRAFTPNGLEAACLQI